MDPALQLVDVDLARTQAEPPLGREIRGLTCRVEAGQVVAVIGETGFGGTRLATAVVGLTEEQGGATPTGGTITVGGRPLARGAASATAPGESPCAFVPSGGGLLPQLSLHDNMLFGVRMREASRVAGKSWLARHRQRRRIRRGHDDACAELERDLDLVRVARYVPDRVGADERLLAALGRALLRDPSVVVVDATSGGEPDDAYRQLLRACRAALDDSAVPANARHRTCGVLVCTDRPGLLADCDLVHVLGWRGAVVARGTPDSLVRPTSVDAAAVLYDGPMLILPPDEVPAGWGRIDAPVGTGPDDEIMVGPPAAAADAAPIEVAVDADPQSGTGDGDPTATVEVEVVGPDPRPGFVRVEPTEPEPRPGHWRLRPRRRTRAGDRLTVTVKRGAAIRLPATSGAAA